MWIGNTLISSQVFELLHVLTFLLYFVLSDIECRLPGPIDTD